MNIVITGSLGNIGKPLTEDLVRKGHSVVVISRSQERSKDIEALGAEASIGSMQDVDFLTKTFKGADIVYLMATLDRGEFSNPSVDIIEAMAQIGKNYKEAIEKSGVEKVIELSAVGAHKDTGNGNMLFHYKIEQTLKGLDDVSIKVLRPAGF